MSENGTNLAVLSLHVSPMPQIKFQLNPTYRSGADVIAGHHGGHLGYWTGTNLAILNLHVTHMPPTVWAQSDLPFGNRGGLNIFKMATMAPILNNKTERFQQI